MCLNYHFDFSFVQKHYWYQGFLRYWQVKQMPNFLLATPVVLIVVKLAVTYLQTNRQVERVS